MRGILRKFILLGVLIWAVNITSAQVKFTASITPSHINKNEYAVLRLEVRNGTNIEQITPPSLKDFNIVSGPNQESGMSNVNGEVTQYVALSYILLPRHPGLISLPSSIAKISGKVFKSNALKLTVSKNAGSSTGAANSAQVNPFMAMDPFERPKPVEDFDDYILKKGESVSEKVNQNMQLKLQVNKTSCYVGEPIVATYKLYTRLKSESKLSKTPSFNGFSVIDLQRPDETEYSREKLNNKEYNVYTIRKAQLYPLQDGTVELESASLDNSIQFVKAEAAVNATQAISGFLDGFTLSPDAIVTETISLSSKPITVTVKPLPDNGKPGSFKGAVGKFNITANLEQDKFSTNETGKLTVTIMGSGNLQLITAPEINWPAGIEPFEPIAKEELEQLSVPVQGKKIFEFPFAIDSPGIYQVPEINFSYFDPARAIYKSIHIPAKQFTVSKGLDKPTYTAGNIQAAQSTSFSKTMFENREWIVAAIALIMFSILGVWFKKDRHQNNNNKVAALTSVQDELIGEQTIVLSGYNSLMLTNPLSKSEDCLYNTDCNQFYGLLYGEMKDWLAAKFNLGKTELNIKTISSALDKAGVDNDIVLQLQQLLQEIEWQLYTPFERNEKMGLIYSRSHTVIRAIGNFDLATTP